LRPRLLLGLAVILAACSGGPDQAEIVTAVADEAIVPNLVAAVSGLEALDLAIGEYCSSLDSVDLDTARGAWFDAKKLWEPAQPSTFFDPGNMLRTVSKVDYSPPSPEGIERLLSSDTPIDDSYVSGNAASTQRGLGAIEYLLFSGDAALDDRRCSLAAGAASVALAEARLLAATWQETYDGAAPFRDRFIQEMTSREALGDVVGAIIETFKRQALFEIGAATGVSAPEPRLDALEEGAAGAGAATYIAQIEGVESWLNAGGDVSLLGLIRDRSPEVAAEIETEMAEAIGELESVDGPMAAVATEDPVSLRPLFDHLNRLLSLFEADVVSLLDVSIGFSDSDGDSG
jgi:predicted lipoprotein